VDVADATAATGDVVTLSVLLDNPSTPDALSCGAVSP